MEKTQKILVFLSYLFGFIALLAVLLAKKENKLFAFHVWQAFLFNLILAALLAYGYTGFLPAYILSLPVAERTAIFLQAVLIPMGVLIVMLALLGGFAASGRKFRIPLVGQIADKIVG